MDVFDVGDIWEKDEHLTLSFSTKVYAFSILFKNNSSIGH